MTAPAWSALADCFAALSTEQEFHLTTLPSDSPAVFQDDPERFRFVYPFEGAPDCPTRVSVVRAHGPFVRGEFARANRFRWLSWAAGLLLDPGPYSPPEIRWWQQLRERHPDRIVAKAADRATLPELARLSAETARRFAGSNGSTPPGTATDTSNWPAIQQSFRPLRDRFNAERWHTARPDAALVSFPDHTVFDLWERRTIDGSAPDATAPRAWMKHGTVWGDHEPVDAFVKFAADAGTALPLGLSFVPPVFPWFNCPSNGNPPPHVCWLEFLYVVCPQCFRVEADSPVPTSRVARLTASAFTTSVQAIDRVLNLDGPAFLREFRVNAARCNPWMTQAERDAAHLAVEAATAPKKVHEPVPPKPIHWTDFPERVVTFGDLLSILETLDRHEIEDGFTAESFENESDTSAYTVDFHNHQHQFHPRLDQMPGLERLLDRFDIDGYPVLTQRQARELRRRAAKALNRDGASLNAVRFTEIADALGSPGSPVVPGPTPASSARQVNTLPASVEPPRHYVEAAMRAIPSVLNNAPQPQGVHDPAGRRGADYVTLRQRLEAVSHNRDAVEWAIHRHVAAGRLEPAPGLSYVPVVIVRGEPPPSGTIPTREREQCVLWAQPALWEWWNAIESGQPMNGVSVSANPTSPPSVTPGAQQPGRYTMQDLRALLRYKQEMAEFEVWRRRTFKPVLEVREVGLRAASLAFNTPQPGRLSEEVANTLGVYRRLLREARTVLNSDLDEPALLYFVGEVADHHKRRIEDMWPLSTDEFDRLMQNPPEAIPGAASSGARSAPAESAGPSEQAPTTTNTSAVIPDNSTTVGKLDRNEGGRPKLGEGPNATPQDKALRNVYELVRGAVQQGWGPKRLVSHFRDNKDFKARVKEAGKDFDEALFRNALAWIKDNPDQETESGNVS